MLHRTRALSIALAALVALAACSKGEEGRGEGVVLSAHDDGRVVIEHDAVPGLIPKSTTEFEIDPDLLRDVAAGDRVRFAIASEGGRFHVTEIREQPPGG